MISHSIDNFISSVAEKKAKDLCDEEVTELSEEVKHQMTLSKEMNINKVDGAYYNNVIGQKFIVWTWNEILRLNTDDKNKLQDWP